MEPTQPILQKAPARNQKEIRDEWHRRFAAKTAETYEAPARTVKKARQKNGAPISAYVFGLVFAGFSAATAVTVHREWTNASDQVLASAGATLGSEARRASDVMNQWIEGSLEPARAAASSADIVAMEADRAATYFKKSDLTKPHIQSLAVTAPDGTQIARNDGKNLINISDRNYFKSGIKGAVKYQFVYSKITNRIALNSAIPVYKNDAATDLDNEGMPKPIGALMSSRDIGTYAQTLFPDFGKTGRSYFLDGAGVVLYSSDGAAQGKSFPPIYAAMENGSSLDVFGHPSHVSAVKVGENYSVVSAMDDQEIDIPMEKAKSDALIFMLAGLAAAIVVSMAVGRMVSRTIKRISDIVDRASKSQSIDELVKLEAQLESGANTSEIKGLARAVKRMIGSIKIGLMA